MSVDRKYIWFDNRYRIKRVVVSGIKLVETYPDNPSVGELYYDTSSQVLYLCENCKDGKAEWKELRHGGAELTDAY